MTLKLITLSLPVAFTLIIFAGCESTVNNLTTTADIFLVCDFQVLSAECQVSGLQNDVSELKVVEIIPKSENFENLTTKFLTISKSYGFSSIPDKIGENFPNLESFRVTRTSITSIGHKDFEGMKDLRHLSLDSNRISIIYQDALYNLQNLESFYISNNKIEFLHPELFKNSLKLKSFIADYNFIPKLHERLFKNNPQLEWISLTKNKLKYIKVNFTELKNIFYANFEKNIEKCDVNLNEQSTDLEVRVQKVAEFQQEVEENC